METEQNLETLRLASMRQINGIAHDGRFRVNPIAVYINALESKIRELEKGWMPIESATEEDLGKIRGIGLALARDILKQI